MEAEARNAGGAGWDSATHTATAGGTQDSGAVGLSGDAAAGGGDTRKAISAASNKAGAGGRHGVRPGIRGRIAGRQ